jgi:hypothetical protein
MKTWEELYQRTKESTDSQKGKSFKEWKKEGHARTFSDLYGENLKEDWNGHDHTGEENAEFRHKNNGFGPAREGIEKLEAAKENFKLTGHKELVVKLETIISQLNEIF